LVSFREGNFRESSLNEVIQAVTFLSPIDGGHQRPLKVSRFHHAKKGHKELPGI